MSDSIWQEAEQRANVGYATVISRDSSDPDEVVYIAVNPELPGCTAQGATVAEARELLRENRITYIEHLLRRNRPVPAPAELHVFTEADTRKQVACQNPNAPIYAAKPGTLSTLSNQPL